MSVPRYPTYKDSGIGWLGDVPEHWGVSRLRFMAMLNPSKKEIGSADPSTEVSFLPMEAIGEDGRLSLDATRSIGEVEGGYTYFREGDVAVAKITPCFENGKGAVMRHLIGGMGFGTTELIVARPRDGETTSDFLHWLFVSSTFRKLGEASMYGAGGQKRVPDDFVRSFLTAWPPLWEQATIAAFLDRETAKIDALVAEQQRLIELLKEKRQAVISHAVTKGLDPNVRMKNSDIEWLGEVPAHWAVSSVGRLCSYISYGFTNPMPTTEDGPYMLTANDIDYGKIRYESARRTSKEAFEGLLTEKSRPRTGDILLTKDGTLGRVAVHDGQQACINQSVAVLRPNTGIMPAFLSMALGGGVYQQRMIYEAGGTTIKHIYISRLAKMPMAIPDRVEQIAIIEALQHKTANFDALIVEAATMQSLLLERRAALISAAVTGKIDVREMVGAELAVA